MSRPLVLLDVDGVLNALPPPGRPVPWAHWCQGVAVAGGRAFRISWSPSVVTAVRAWHERADVRWLTTWGHDANGSLRALLGLPELPVAGTYDDRDAEGVAVQPEEGGAPVAHAAVAPAAPDPLDGRWWKLDVVRRLVRAEPGRPLVWLDDDLAGQDDVRTWLAATTPALLVAPSPGSGLTEDDLRAVEAFLDRFV